jgi:hypothetical protein
MAMIHINRSGAGLGTFSEGDVREGLRTGRFIGTDLGWREGMATWQPLSQFAEFAATAPGGPPPSPAPGETPTIAPVASTGSPLISPPARRGLPWEDRQGRGFIHAFVETLQMVLARPSEAFAVMRTEGGLGEPLIYALIGGCAGALVSFLFSLGFQSIGLIADQQNRLVSLVGLGIGSVAFIFLAPVFIIIGLFIGAAIIHLCLMIVGGANKSFETTFRVLAFSQGSTGPLQIIPICGGLIACIWALVINCIGLARAHETETGRAVLAVLLPLIVCCGGGILLVILAGGIGALSHWNH